MVNVWNLKPGAAIRIVKTFRDYAGNEFPEGRILHFTRRNYVPYHSGHTVYFREATMYLCDDDQTSAIVQNHNGEYFVLTEQSDCEPVYPDFQSQSPGDEPTHGSASRSSNPSKREQYKTLLASMLAVATAFGIAIRLGFLLRSHLPLISDQVFGAIVVLILLGIAAGAVRLLGIPLWPAKKHQSRPGMRPDPDIDPNKDWSSNGAGCRTGYEISFEDFRRLVSDPYCQPVIAPLLKNWYGYDIVGQGTGTVVCSPEGQVVGLRVLHNRIQIDPPKQRTIYDRAMDLWR